MKYDLHRPCDSCPFRSDGKGATLRPGRVEELELQLTMGEFACHKTVDYDVDDEYPYGGMDDASHCAGALILLEKMEQPHQMMRIAERLSLYDRHKLVMESPVFPTWDDMLAHMEDAERGSGTEELCKVCDNWLDSCICERPVDTKPKRKSPPPPPPRRKRKVPPPPPPKPTSRSQS